MNQMDGTFTLPSAEDMEARLLAFDDDPYMRENLYPHLLKHAGQTKVPMGVVMALVMASNDFTKGLPQTVWIALSMRLPQLVDALVDDPAVREQIKQELALVMG